MRKMILAGLYIITISIIFNLVLFIIGYRNLAQALKYGVIEGN